MNYGTQFNLLPQKAERWFEESDLDIEDLAGAAIKALEDWLDKEVVGFEG
jgi:hypothetical protein